MRKTYFSTLMLRSMHFLALMAATVAWLACTMKDSLAQTCSVAELRNTQWIEVGPAVDQGLVTFVVAADGSVRGYSACNSYRASIDPSSADLRVGFVGATRMACDAERMAKEQRFWEALAQTRHACQTSGWLELLDEQREVLWRFEDAGSSEDAADSFFLRQRQTQ